MPLPIFSERLKDLMLIEGVSQHKLSSAANVQRKSVSNWLRGINYPRYDALIRVADYFHISTDYLIGINNTAESCFSRYPIEAIQPRLICKITNFLTENNRTKYSLAKEIDIEQSTMERWFSVGAMPEVSILIKLVKIMRESLDELLGRTPDTRL